MPDSAVPPGPRPGWLLPVLLAVAATLSGCGGNKADEFAPACPTLRLRPDAADLVRTRGQGVDVTDLILEARITGAPASCKGGGKGGDTGTVEADVQVQFEATRGPAATSRTVDLPYLITVTKGDRILDQKAFAVTAQFPANVDRMTLTGEDVNFAFPVSPQSPASDYTIYVTFRLTPEELEYNRRHPH